MQCTVNADYRAILYWALSLLGFKRSSNVALCFFYCLISGNPAKSLDIEIHMVSQQGRILYKTKKKAIRDIIVSCGWLLYFSAGWQVVFYVTNERKWLVKYMLLTDDPVHVILNTICLMSYFMIQLWLSWYKHYFPPSLYNLFYKI